MNGLVEVIDRYGSIDNLPKKETLKSDLSREQQEELLEKLAAARDGNIAGVGSFRDKTELLKECAEEAEGTGISPAAMNRKKRKKAEDESGRYLIALTEAARSIDDDVLANAEGFDNYQKMYLFYLKYGDSLFVDGTMKKGVFYYNDIRMMSMHDPEMFRIEAVTFDEKTRKITFEGRALLDSMSLLIGVNASTVNAGTYKADRKNQVPDRHDRVVKFSPFMGADIRGFASEPFITGQKFTVTTDLRPGTEIRFLAELVNSGRVSLRVRMGRYAGFGTGSLHGYRVIGGYILQQHVNYLSVEKATPELIKEAEDEYVQGMAAKKGDKWLDDRKKENELKELAETGEIAERTVFVTTRGNGLKGGMKRLYDMTDGDKEIIAAAEPWSDETVRKAVDLIFHSATVVMDSPVPVLKMYSKREGQRFIQLWHGIAAYRKICGDEPDVLPCVDSLYHRDYDMLTVSSYRMKDIYAGAMRLDPSRIAVTGSPDSDDCFDSEKIEADREKSSKSILNSGESR
ncbi:MAG: CDP-glycerol glycerophosphotransferase family protein [Anaerovoracaceae bacterium]